MERQLLLARHTTRGQHDLPTDPALAGAVPGHPGGIELLTAASEKRPRPPRRQPEVFAAEG